jgi:hypothetical protein
MAITAQALVLVLVLVLVGVRLRVRLRVRRAVSVVAAVAVASCALSFASIATSAAGPVARPMLAKPAVPATGAYFGAWRGPGPGRPTDARSSLLAIEQSIGRKYAIDHRYYDWGSVIPNPYLRWTAAHGRIPMVSVCACHFKDKTFVPWASIASGTEDAYLISVAKGFASFAQPAFFVFEAEAELQVGIRGTAADYRAAFHHIVAVFHAQGATNVAFVWATTAYAFRPESADRALAASMYPGDGAVDWIASDPYNFDYGGAWHSLAYELDPWYQWATKVHAAKPLALTEWGSKEDPLLPNHKAAWFRGALTSLESHYPAIHAVVYFDERKLEHRTVNDWRVDTSPASLAAFAEIAHAAWFRP